MPSKKENAGKPKLKPMADAPRDGTWVRLHLRAGGTVIGCYNDKFGAWHDVDDPTPLGMHDRHLLGWEAIDQDAARAERKTAWPRSKKHPRKPVKVIGLEAAQARIVAAKPPSRPSRKPRKPITVIGRKG